MQQALNKAAEWATANGLSFSPEKTHAVLFTRKKKYASLPILKMYGREIKNSKEVKLLGVTLKANLLWTSHVKQKIQACKRALMMLQPVLRKKWSPRPEYTRWIYTGIILPMLTYGSVVWSRAVSSPGIRKMLGRLQRLGLTSIANVRKGTPTSALEIIYNVPPLHLLIEQTARNAFIRLGDLKNEEWFPANPNHHGHIRYLRSFFTEGAATDDITAVPNRDRSYSVKISKTLKPQTKGIVIYTDGSLIENKSGSGAVIYLDSVPYITLSENLPDCTVYQSEARAIQMACEYMYTYGTTGQRISFHVDNQAILKSLAAGYISNETTRKTAELLNNLAQHNVVSLQWVKAHVGILGNEEADAAAKAGAKGSRRRINTIKPARNVLKKLTKLNLNKNWQDLWDKNEECRQSKLFLSGPNPKIWQDLRKLQNEETSRVVRFVTGHCYMRRHRVILEMGYEFQHDQVAMCSLCQEEQETPEHLITECPVLNNTRLDTLYCWQLDRPPPWNAGIINFINSPAVKALEARPVVERTE